MVVTSIETLNAIGILRVSSKPQEDAYGLDSQLDDVKSGADRLGFRLVDVVRFQESASNPDNRRKFDELLQTIVGMGRRGEVQAVILGRWDRLARDGRNAGGYYLETLRRAGIQVRMGDPDFDVDPDDPDYDRRVSEYFGESKTEVIKITKRTSKGRRKRAEKGLIPNGSVPWCFDYESKTAIGVRSSGRPILNTGKAEWVRKWVGWFLHEKITLWEACRRMDASGYLPPMAEKRVRVYLRRWDEDDQTQYGEPTQDNAYKKLVDNSKDVPAWTPPAIQRALLNPSLLGKFYAYRKDSLPLLVYEDADLVVISEEEQEALIRHFSENKRLSSRNTQRWYPPIKGFTYCHCGRLTTGKYNHGKHPVFRCTACKFRKGCYEHYVNAVPLWEDVKSIVSMLISHPDQVLPALREISESMANREALETRKLGIESELDELKASMRKAARMHVILPNQDEDLFLGIVHDIESRRKRLLEDLEEVNQALKSHYEVEITNQRLIEVCREFKGVLETASDEEWKGLLREFGVRVTIQPDGNHLIQISVDLDTSVVSHHC